MTALFKKKIKRRKGCRVKVGATLWNIMVKNPDEKEQASDN